MDITPPKPQPVGDTTIISRTLIIIITTLIAEAINIPATITTAAAVAQISLVQVKAQQKAYNNQALLQRGLQ
jgi:hypothetical protein